MADYKSANIFRTDYKSLRTRIIMIYIMMMMKEYLPKERFGMFAVFNFCLG